MCFLLSLMSRIFHSSGHCKQAFAWSQWRESKPSECCPQMLTFTAVYRLIGDTGAARAVEYWYWAEYCCYWCWADIGRCWVLMVSWILVLLMLSCYCCYWCWADIGSCWVLMLSWILLLLMLSCYWMLLLSIDVENIENIYCHSLSIKYNVICLQNVYKINFYF